MMLRGARNNADRMQVMCSLKDPAQHLAPSTLFPLFPPQTSL
jgi:hypothetical protein